MWEVDTQAIKILVFLKILSTWNSPSLLSALYHWDIIIILLFIQACNFSTFGPLCHLIHAILNLGDSLHTAFTRNYSFKWVDFYPGIYHFTINSITEFSFFVALNKCSPILPATDIQDIDAYFLRVSVGRAHVIAHACTCICIVRSSYFLTDVTVHVLKLQPFLVYSALCTQGAAVLPVLRIFHSGGMNKGYLRNQIQKIVTTFLL